MVFGVLLDRLDNQVQFVRAVYLARHAVIFAWGDAVRSGEVVEAVESLVVRRGSGWDSPSSTDTAWRLPAASVA